MPSMWYVHFNGADIRVEADGSLSIEIAGEVVTFEGSDTSILQAAIAASSARAYSTSLLAAPPAPPVPDETLD